MLDMKLTARHAIALMAVASSLLLLTGCGASLSVQPGALSLSDTKPNEQVSISNEGSGTLVWTAESTVPWLLLSFGEEAPQAIISGSTGVVDIFDMHLITDALPEDADQITTELLVRSNGGDTVIPVAISRPLTPTLEVEPVSLDFGSTETEKLAEILNQGEATLQWEAVIPEGIDWVTITPASGAVARASAEGVKVTVNRAKLTPSATPYRVNIAIDSNGGAGTLEVVVEAPAFTATPDALDFGLLRVATPLTITVKTLSAEEVALSASITYTSGDGWLQLAPAAATITSDTPADLLVTAAPGALAPGVYTAAVNITHAPTARTVSIPVSMEVGLPVSFRVEPNVISFGDTRETVQQVVTLINEGDEPIEWVAQKPGNASWLTVSPANGVLDDTLEVTLIADPALLDPGTIVATVIFDAGGVTHQVRTSLNRLPDPVPDSLEVEPRELDFGPSLSVKEVTLWNDGPSRLDWTIDGASLPAWLSISPLGGFVEGDLVQNLQVAVDREQAPADVSFSHTFVITPTGADGLQPVEVTVRAEQLFAPLIVVTGEGVSGGVPSVLADIGEDYAEFTIRNEGNADLRWSIDQESLPGWIASIVPRQGTVKPGREQTVRVTVNRTGLNSNGDSYRLLIRSDDPSQGETLLEVQVRVPFTMTIDVLPGELNFGRKASTASFRVANLGDLGTRLEFKIEPSDRNLVSVEPEREDVTSTTPPSYVPISVAIDREQLTGTGAIAYLTISAENVPDNFYPVKPVTVPIIVDAAELTIETAVPRGRQPSLVRFNMLLRDIRQRVFPEFVDNPLDLETIFPLNTVTADIIEDSDPLDLNETNVIIKKDETLTFAVLIMLDFSGSMAEAAQMLVADGQLDPGTLDPLEALYIEAIGPMLDAFPDHYRVALGVFNERRPFFEDNLRLVTGAPVGYTLKESVAAFTSNKDIQRHRLLNLDVADNGATPLYPAVKSGATSLVLLDSTLPDFDAVANRILVMVTDGRRTTPPGELQSLLDYFEEYKVRVFPIGWGNEVLANPMIQMSTGSGGHYYGTENKVIGTDLDGNPIEIPVKNNLLDRCRANPDAPSVPRDLASHVVVSYASLNEEDSAQLQVNMQVSTVNPSVKESILFDQVPLGNIANDVRLGQIGARSEGIQGDGTARVRFYADYIPRNITRLVFEIGTVPEQTWTVDTVLAEEGGLIAEWGVSRIGNRITLTALPSDPPLAYGDYGNLFDINLSGIAAAFDMTILMVEPVIGANPDGKYFTLPDLIPVRYEPTNAVSFPNPEFTFSPPAVSEISNVYNLGNLDPLAPEDRNLDITVDNIGGEHVPTNATLYWRLRVGELYVPGTIPIPLEFEFNGPIAIDTEDYYWMYDADMVSVLPVDVYDEFGVLAVDPGTYSAQFFIDVFYGSLGYVFTHGPYYLQFTVP